MNYEIDKEIIGLTSDINWKKVAILDWVLSNSLYHGEESLREFFGEDNENFFASIRVVALENFQEIYTVDEFRAEVEALLVDFADTGKHDDEFSEWCLSQIKKIDEEFPNDLYAFFDGTPGEYGVPGFAYLDPDEVEDGFYEEFTWDSLSFIDFVSQYTKEYMSY